MTTASRAADFGASPARQSIDNVGISPDDIPLPRATTRDRVAFVALLVGTAALYLWNITVNGNANTFYAGAAWAGSRNWEALLFGSVDPSNFITVDKPPVSQWIMGLSGQVFGYSSASMLVPEAVMGVASVALLYATVTRVSGRTAGLIAGAALALTPVAAMMFRFNNPDAAMVLLMTAAAYCTVRATSRASMRWLVLAGVALGFAFLAKMLEGLMVLPALGFVYLLAAPTSLGRRVCHLLAATLALVVSSGWYVLLTLLWPASSRPYLAGSTDNNFMNLVLGYNGLDRIAGHGGGHSPAPADMEQLARENPALTGGFGGGMFGSAPGISRLFGGEFGAEISFLLPSALVAFVVVLVLRGRMPRTDLVRAGALLFGLWLLVDGIVLSYMSGTVHPYYSLAIAPPVAGLVGIGVVEAWRARSSTTVWKMITARVGLAAMIVSGGIWAFALLDREPSWFPWLRWVVLIVAVLAGVLAVVPITARRPVAAIATGCGVLAILSAPAAFAINGDTVAHTGGSPSVLPGHAGSSGSAITHSAAYPTHNRAGGVFESTDRQRGGFGSAPDSPALDRLLASSTARWAAATSRTSTAAALELDARVPVMGIGGFSNDPTPTLAQFQKYVADNEIGYYVVAAGGPGSADRAPSGSTYTHGAGGSRSGSVTVPIQQWVASHYTGHTVGDYTVYDLSAGTRSAGSSTSAHTAAAQQQRGRPMPASQSGYRHRFHHLARN
ncbi:glycosyltransferase family 39 protein [Gordonia otitidis]|uniref:ArnT family glycosyltransferase n=1 Tax=Gordonia otitidis TaxID=249058 RepID=UPI001D1481C8|nr:glycosyltransferase family 39 protein [Gordonia otitidis]UEA58345.1 glycosyltransferase family 39 protein [Gordonia otitidis]